MQTWEYRVESLALARLAEAEIQQEVLQKILDRIGQHGWELVHLSSCGETLGPAVFKRPHDKRMTSA
jgi:hypothetical protein